jgi:hypothetical protein
LIYVLFCSFLNDCLFDVVFFVYYITAYPEDYCICS